MKKILLVIIIVSSLQNIHSQMAQPIFDAFNYGAIGDGKTNDQESLQKAIDACKGTGGAIFKETKVMKYDGTYPEGSKFGNTNAMALFVRHTDKISFINCKIDSEKQDARK